MSIWKPCPNLPAPAPQPLKGAWRLVICPSCAEVIALSQDDASITVTCTSEHVFQVDQNIYTFSQMTEDYNDGITEL